MTARLRSRFWFVGTKIARSSLVTAAIAVPGFFDAGVGAFAACRAERPVAVDLTAEPFYTDAAHSVVDPAATARNREALKTIDAALGAIVAHSDAYLKTGDPGEAACAAAMLAHQATGGAMTGTMSSRQADYERKWRTVGFAIAHLIVREQASLDQRAAIEPWLRLLGDRVEAGDTRPANWNNHHYWIGLAATAVGAATGDPARLARGRARFDDGLAAIAADGTLPKEMARRARALHYHAYALAPLVYAAEIAAHVGEDWWGRGDGALHRLAARVSAGTADPAWFTARAGVAVEPASASTQCWAAFYQRRFPGRITVPGPDAPCRNTMLGGDAVALARAWIR